MSRTHKTQWHDALDRGADPVAVAAVSLGQQLEEVELQIENRRATYSKILAAKPSRKSELQFHMVRLFAVRDTLQILVNVETANAMLKEEGGEQ